MKKLIFVATFALSIFGCSQKQEPIVIHHNDCPILKKIPYDINTTGLKNAEKLRLYKIILKQKYIIKYYEDQVDQAMKLRNF